MIDILLQLSDDGKSCQRWASI